MGDHPPTRRRFQFGLRKLMLWTVVVAVFLGIFEMFGFGWIGCVLAACWLAVVGLLRGTAGGRAACLVSIVIGTVLIGWCSYLVYVTASPRPPFNPVIVLFAAIWGSAYGLFVFVLTTAVCSAVNWADNLMRPKTDD
jgi:hypothetical protein